MPIFFGSKTELIKHIQQSNSDSTKGKLTLTASVLKGKNRDHLWSVWKSRRLDGSIGTFIRLDVLFQRKNRWGNNTLWEEENPLYITCPTVFLSMAPDVKSHEWRSRVNLFAKCENREIKLGKRYLLDSQPIPWVDIVSVDRIIIGEYRGIQYKISRNMIMSELERRDEVSVLQA